MPERRLPDWIKRPIRTDAEFGRVHRILREQRLNTVCRSARCPNRHECWAGGTATFMILGEVCSRACRFCAVSRGRPAPPDSGEPARVARAAVEMHLRHVVVTSVTRDDLSDGGSGAFAETIRALRGLSPTPTIEVLTPDFGGQTRWVDLVLDAGPDVFNHNLETVRRMQPSLRPQASYDTSLGVLRHAAGRAGPVAVKSGLMLGLGEREDEILETLRDLHAAGCRRVTLGQYLAPTREAWPVDRYLTPEEFDRLEKEARRIGFQEVASGPLVRSSYQAERMMQGAGGCP
jgi:lipoic acid synthetase